MMKRLFLIILILFVLGSVVYCGQESRKAENLKFYADVFAWFPDGKVSKITPGNGIYYQSCIHPDGTHVVFAGNSSGTPRVWNALLKTGLVAPLTPPDWGAWHPVFSWDGKSIAFASDHIPGQKPGRIEDMNSGGSPPSHLSTNIFIMDSNGENIQRVTKGSYKDQRPSFSPDGKQIVFVSNRSGRKDVRLWLVPIDGSTEPRPLQKQDWGYRPWFSVDGKWIFFITGIPRKLHYICKIPVEGGEVVRVSKFDSGFTHGPFADPKGKSILVHSNWDGSWKIWELALDGGTPRELMPPGVSTALHGTRSKNGIIAFDSFTSIR